MSLRVLQAIKTVRLVLRQTCHHGRVGFLEEGNMTHLITQEPCETMESAVKATGPRP